MYHVSDIAGFLQTLFSGEDFVINDFQVDSRKITKPNSTLFFCLKGNRTDGHVFIKSLYERGVRCFVVNTKNKLPDLPHVIYFKVNDVMEALHQIALFHRNSLHVPILAITGSNGKTIVKEWSFQLLHTQLNVYRSPGSYNSQIGVPLSILGIQGNEDLAIIEAGISQVGEMEHLERMIKPNYGIFTFLGSAHGAGFESDDEKLKSKSSLFKNAEWWISNNIYAQFFSKNHISVGSSGQDQDIVIEDTENTLELEGLHFVLPFQDKASKQNLSLVLAFISKFKPQLLPSLISKCRQLLPVDMRVQIRKGIRNNTIISDHYNADIEGLSNVLELAQGLDVQKDKRLILSDFLGVKNVEESLDATIDIINQSSIDHVWLVGTTVQKIKDYLHVKGEVLYFDSTEDILTSKRIQVLTNELIILKGARSFHFESIENQLLQPIIGTYLQINLEALYQNWITLKKQLNAGVKSTIMIKAAAYGSGLIEIAKFYQKHKADYIGVAYPNEGVELRENGIELPILVMNSHPSITKLLIQYNLQPVVHSLIQLEGFVQQSHSINELHFHLKLNTGMNRLGLDAKDIPRALELISEVKNMNCVSIMSHLSASDDPNQDSFSLQQIELFKSLCDFIRNSLPNQPIRHILNSQGSLRFPQAQFEMVRWGLALYGISNVIPELHLQPVHSYRTHIVQLRSVEKGTSIGYNATTKVSRPSIIATIPVGYADGIPRSLSDGKLFVYIEGEKVFGIGKICMDMTMLDVTDIQGLKEGMEVEIFGKNTSIEQLALQAETIPYEILVRISKRVERVFING